MRGYSGSCVCVLYYADTPKGFLSIEARRLKKSAGWNFDIPFHAGDVVPDMKWAKSRRRNPLKAVSPETSKSSKIIKRSDKELLN